MANNWKALEAVNDRMVLGAYDELVRHSPMKSGVADPARPAAEIRGVLHTPAAAGTISLGNGMMTTLSASEGALVINRADYPDRVFAKLDKIRGLETPGQPWWEIKTVNDRFSSIIVLVLNQA